VGAAVGGCVGVGACVAGGGAFSVRSAITVWAAWVWIAAVSTVGAAVGWGVHALKMKTAHRMIAKLRLIVIPLLY